MKRISLILILIFLCSYSNFACLNGETKVLKDGTGLYVDTDDAVPYGHTFLMEDFEDILNRLDSFYRTTKNIDYLSDKGLVLILMKQYKKAISLYLDLEKQRPGRYSTASNIGTAYELAGQNANALAWIKKAVQLEPASHDSSEWIHVNILEGKIRGERFYTTKFLLHTDFGSDKRPSSTLGKDQLLALYNQLFYQLNERVSFIKSEDKIVAQLMFDLGNIAFLNSVYDVALIEYRQAKEYGYSGQLIAGRIKEAEQLNKDEPQKRRPVALKQQKMWPFVLAGLVILILAVLLLFLLKRRNKPKAN